MLCGSISLGEVEKAICGIKQKVENARNKARTFFMAQWRAARFAAGNELWRYAPLSCLSAENL